METSNNNTMEYEYVTKRNGERKRFILIKSTELRNYARD